MSDPVPAPRAPDKPHGQELIDFGRLSQWMDALGLPEGPVENVAQLTGGSQNVIVRFERAGRHYVLRRPPLHPTKNGSETMRREARVLRGLADSDVPHARLIADCSSEDVLGASFYLMEPVEGFNAALGLPPLYLDSADNRHAMGLEIVDILARIGNVDYAAAGLADLGRPKNFLERQVPRWRKQLESYRQHDGWPGPESIPRVDRVATWLEDNLPRSFTPGLMHGDYHFKNVMFRYDVPGIAAVVDWELTTIGDPLVDLGWVLATWRDRGESASDAIIVVEPWDNFPDLEELVARYAQSSHRDLSAISWYAIFACYKLGLILEGTYARSLAGKAPVEIGARLRGNVLRLFDKAQRWIATPPVKY